MRGEHNRRRRPGRRDHVESMIVDRLFADVETKVPQVQGEPAARVSFAAGGRVDVDKSTRQLDEIDARAHYLIHASSSVRVLVSSIVYGTNAGLSKSISLRTRRIFSFDSARGGHIGSRYTSSSSPIAAIAAFTGTGLDSTKFTCISEKILLCTVRAAAKSPRSAASTIATISPGISFATTDTMPRPPIDISGSVIASSPDSTMKLAGTPLTTSQICEMFPEASLTPTMFGISVRRSNVRVSMLVPVRPWML